MKKFKTAKNAISRRKKIDLFDFTSFFAWTFLNFLTLFFLFLAHYAGVSDGLRPPNSVAATTAAASTKRKSQSLDQLNSQAMWRSETEEVMLEKGDKGLGFSILDYQDPLNTSETVIVVRSLVPGGIAHLDGRIVPGDRIIYVNHVVLEHASLDTAVQALKGAPFGSVRIGISRPLVDDNYEGQLMMGQLRERLAENETPLLTTSTTTDVSIIKIPIIY